MPINDVCVVCTKTVYPVEKCTADDKVMHKACLRCGHCKKLLSLGNYAALNGTFYCKPHFKQLFALKGNYTDGFASNNANTSAPKGDANYTERSRKESQTSASSNFKVAKSEESAVPAPQTPQQQSIATGKSLAERLHAYEAVVRSSSQEIERSGSRRQRDSLPKKEEQGSRILSSSHESIPVPSERGISSYLNAYKEAASNANLNSSNTNLDTPSVRRVSREWQSDSAENVKQSNDEQSKQLKVLQSKYDSEVRDRQRLENEVSELKRTLAARDHEIAKLQQKTEDLEYQNQQLQQAVEDSQNGQTQETGRYRQDEGESNWDDEQ